MRQEVETKGDVSVAFLRKGMSPRTYPIFSIVDAGARLVVDQHIPTLNARPELRTQSPDALRQLGATHLLFDGPVPDRTRQSGELVWQQGEWNLLRLREPGHRDPPWSTVEGQRAVELSWARESDGWSLELKGAAEAVPVRAAITPYFRWTLRQADGSLIELEAVQLALGLQGLGFELPSSGSYRLMQHELAREGRARLASWLCFLACLAGLTSTRTLGGSEREAPPKWMRYGPQILTAAAALLILGGLLRQSMQEQAIWQAAYERAQDSQNRPTAPLRYEVLHAQDLELSQPTRPACSSLEGRDPQLGCDPSTHRDQPTSVPTPLPLPLPLHPPRARRHPYPHPRPPPRAPHLRHHQPPPTRAHPGRQAHRATPPRPHPANPRVRPPTTPAPQPNPQPRPHLPECRGYRLFLTPKANSIRLR